MNRMKKSILIYFDNFPMLTALPPEQRGWLLTVLMIYGERLSQDETVTLDQVLEQFPQLTSEARLVCGFMGANIRRDTQRWLSRQQARSAPAARGPMPAGRKPAPIPPADLEKRAREDMERTRKLMEQLKES